MLRTLKSFSRGSGLSLSIKLDDAVPKEKSSTQCLFIPTGSELITGTVVVQNANQKAIPVHKIKLILVGGMGCEERSGIKNDPPSFNAVKAAYDTLLPCGMFFNKSIFKAIQMLLEKGEVPPGQSTYPFTVPFPKNVFPSYKSRADAAPRIQFFMFVGLWKTKGHDTDVTIYKNIELDIRRTTKWIKPAEAIFEGGHLTGVDVFYRITLPDHIYTSSEYFDVTLSFEKTEGMQVNSWQSEVMLVEVLTVDKRQYEYKYKPIRPTGDPPSGSKDGVGYYGPVTFRIPINKLYPDFSNSDAEPAISVSHKIKISTVSGKFSTWVPVVVQLAQIGQGPLRAATASSLASDSPRSTIAQAPSPSLLGAGAAENGQPTGSTPISYQPPSQAAQPFQAIVAATRSVYSIQSPNSATPVSPTKAEPPSYMTFTGSEMQSPALSLNTAQLSFGSPRSSVMSQSTIVPSNRATASYNGRNSLSPGAYDELPPVAQDPRSPNFSAYQQSPATQYRSPALSYVSYQPGTPQMSRSVSSPGQSLRGSDFYSPTNTQLPEPPLPNFRSRRPSAGSMLAAKSQQQYQQQQQQYQQQQQRLVGYGESFDLPQIPTSPLVVRSTPLMTPLVTPLMAPMSPRSPVGAQYASQASPVGSNVVTQAPVARAPVDTRLAQYSGQGYAGQTDPAPVPMTPPRSPYIDRPLKVLRRNPSQASSSTSVSTSVSASTSSASTNRSAAETESSAGSHQRFTALIPYSQAELDQMLVGNKINGQEYLRMRPLVARLEKLNEMLLDGQIRPAEYIEERNKIIKS
ncbi:uncharacterized protein BJ171DRAFT_158046 [Polychytrium aggregatum]|uniref:uncharacterized protein n=1 Tax=Polychytrium aggregatum TaxID=110093 RepID=UPI0022FE40F8|nr:uncharacterized protein BJ171DRAFT_158046 [Polychytrium aggregatum]KAI9203013.1 hypothetical protein BJ171DRAFT_158046 [Polychytrium aggregatum]